MNLDLSGVHIRQRMAERGITRPDIEQALRNVLSEWPTRSNSVQYLGRTDNGRELIVWIVEPGLAAPVSTVKSAAWK